ncbi:MAG: hypothetical protein JWP87_6134 [Labilithrix sp.]|nr:hypothetical protein [Labilithrix sp.]
MDPNNPRWETSEERRRRSATMWKIIVGALSASALSAMVVASCLDRDAGARRDVDTAEPAYVETTAAAQTPATTTPVQPAPPSTADSTGGIAVNGRAADPASTTETTGATIVNAPAATSVNVTSAPPAGAPSYSPRPAPFETAAPAGAGAMSLSPGASSGLTVAPGQTTDSANAANAATDAANPDGGAPVAGHASHAANDPNNRGSNPESPPMNAGAGRFVTEAPYWGASAFESNADAGAGPFQSERNTPAH